MKLSDFNLAQLPVIPVRNGLTVDSASLSDLASVGVGLVSFGVLPDDIIEFPETEADVIIKKRQVRANSTAFEYLLAVKKNGKAGWFSVGNLDRRDAHYKPVHPVAEHLATCASHEERIRACLGKTIKGTEKIDVVMPEFDNGTRLDTTVVKQMTKLVFVD